MKTYCITGGAGFIGSHLVRFLMKEGHQVIVIDNFCDYYPLAYKIDNVLRSVSAESRQSSPKTVKRVMKDIKGIPHYHLYAADIRDMKALLGIFDFHDVDAVIHLAAMAGVRPSILDPFLYEEVNIKGTLNVLEACRLKNVKKTVIASSSSVYGNTRTLPFREDMPVDHPISPYAATKKATELMASVYHHLYGLDTVLLRFFTVYGPGQRPDLAIHKFTKALFEGREITLFGDGTMKRDYTYIDDIIHGTAEALNYVEKKEKVYEIINLGESRTVSLEELISFLQEKTGKKARIRYESQPPGDVDTTYADLEKARRLLNYSPQVAIEEGLSHFVSWCQEYYNF